MLRWGLFDSVTDSFIKFICEICIIIMYFRICQRSFFLHVSILQSRVSVQRTVMLRMCCLVKYTFIGFLRMRIMYRVHLYSQACSCVESMFDVFIGHVYHVVVHECWVHCARYLFMC